MNLKPMDNVKLVIDIFTILIGIYVIAKLILGNN